MNPIAVLKRYFANVERSRQLLEEIREGVANLTDVTNRHLIRLTQIMDAAIEDSKREELTLGQPSRAASDQSLDTRSEVPGETMRH